MVLTQTEASQHTAAVPDAEFALWLLEECGDDWGMAIETEEDRCFIQEYIVRFRRSYLCVAEAVAAALRSSS